MEAQPLLLYAMWDKVVCLAPPSCYVLHSEYMYVVPLHYWYILGAYSMVNDLTHWGMELVVQS